ncbi:MAG: histidine kinase [Chloroflexia bacterium]|nr:histidine kinase [Chloroflexia bacterium]
MTSEQVAELKRQIAELQARWPAHSVPPAMLQQLEELEEALERARQQAKRQEPPNPLEENVQ